MDEIEVNGKKYILASKAKSPTMAKKNKGKEYAIVRTYSAGVFAGYIQKEQGQEITLSDARRIWYWEGAASLSQLSIDGTSKPDKCKFPKSVIEVRLKQVIEILPCTEKSKESILGVPEWSK